MPISEKAEQMIRRYHRCHDDATVSHIQAMEPDGGCLFLVRTEDEKGNKMSHINGMMILYGETYVMEYDCAPLAEEERMVAVWMEAINEDYEEEDEDDGENEHAETRD